MNIYISGLSYNVNDGDLNELFAEYGEVTSSKVIIDRESGKSKGFGFVEMSNDTEGQAAIDGLNGVEYDGKTIAVSVARPRENRPSFGGGDRRRDNNRGGNNGGFRRY